MVFQLSYASTRDARISRGYKRDIPKAANIKASVVAVVVQVSAKHWYG